MWDLLYRFICGVDNLVILPQNTLKNSDFVLIGVFWHAEIFVYASHELEKGILARTDFFFLFNE